MEEFISSLSADTVITFMGLVSVIYGFLSLYILTYHFRYDDKPKTNRAKFLIGGTGLGFFLFIVFLFLCPKTMPDTIAPPEMINLAKRFLCSYLCGIIAALFYSILSLVEIKRRKHLNKKTV